MHLEKNFGIQIITDIFLKTQYIVKKREFLIEMKKRWSQI